jgi:hypothetical protein
VPRYSIVIPTLARADTLEHSLQTVLAQTVDDFEVVVQNNGNDAATRDLVESFSDPRVRLLHTDEVVSMGDNWERGLTNCTGDLVTVLGDDDALLPDACEAAGRALDLTGSEIVSWAPFLYLWPSYWHERRRNRLHANVTFDFLLRVERSRTWLERLYRFEADYSELPMLYNSFVSRSVVERIRGRYGKYFFGSLPDVTSGIINAAETETFVKASRPLSIAGISGHSFGHKLSREDSRLSESDLERHFPGLAARGDALASTELHWLVAIEMAVLDEEVLHDRAPVEFDRRGLAWQMARTINESPSRYGETKRLIEELMQTYEIAADELEIPPPTPDPPAPSDGIRLLAPAHAFFVIDGNRLGMQTIRDALMLATQLVPPVDAITVAAPLTPEPAAEPEEQSP